MKYPGTSGNPAFPANMHLGITKRCYACIQLRVPDSDEKWLDDLISRANRRDTANLAMQGMLSHSTRYNPRPSDKGLSWHAALVKEAYEIADEIQLQETNNLKK